jgi:hypothetical protein
MVSYYCSLFGFSPKIDNSLSKIDKRHERNKYAIVKLNPFFLFIQKIDRLENIYHYNNENEPKKPL